MRERGVGGASLECNAQARQHHLCLMNLGPEVLTSEEVASLDSMRWEVELCFFELTAS